MTHQQLFRYLYVFSILKDHGRVNRSDLIRVFGISAPQASKDLTSITELWPGAMRYDPKAKAYVVETLPIGVHWNGLSADIRLVAEHIGQLLELLAPWVPKTEEAP